MGAACFLYALNGSSAAKDPVDAASESSLDEVAWGLAWPDFLRLILPWFFGRLIVRGRALEKAWALNATSDPRQRSGLKNVLSSWNAAAEAGTLPGIIMNATVSETGERLLFDTTALPGHLAAEKARIDAADLHGPTQDVRIVTAARLSATFPYVTPASRSKLPGPQPHAVDGGYYDNYGMATLVEWLDAALEYAGQPVKSVLVLQIHGVPVGAASERPGTPGMRGWFYQLLAPVSTLVHVRSAGQVAHNDIELGLLQNRWRDRNSHSQSSLRIFQAGPAAVMAPHSKREEPDTAAMGFERSASLHRESSPIPEWQRRPGLRVSSLPQHAGTPLT